MYDPNIHGNVYRSFKTDCTNSIEEIRKILPVNLKLNTIFNNKVTINELIICKKSNKISINMGLSYYLEVYILNVLNNKNKYDICFKQVKSGSNDISEISDITSINRIEDYIELHFKENFYYIPYPIYFKFLKDNQKILDPAKIDWDFKYNFQRLLMFYFNNIFNYMRKKILYFIKDNI